MEYPNATKEDRGAMVYGKLKISPENIIFKNSKTGKVDQIGSNEIEKVNWQRLAGGWGLRILLQSGMVYRFGGFLDDDDEKLQKFFADNMCLKMEIRELSLKGWNWGTARFDGNVLSFDIDKLPVCDIPLSNVSHCTTAKNEVTLEFHQNDDAAVSLMEMRFHIPTTQDSDADPVEAFKENVLSKASIIQATGESLATFKELQCLTPRGRYDIKIFATFIQLHGKTFDYKIPLTTVLRIFLLPHKDNRQMHFVLSLDPPIKQGQTRYHFLILLFSKEEEIDIELSMSEQDIKEKYEDKLQKNMSGPTFEVLSKIMKAVSQRKITTPNYKSHTGTCCITCSYKSGYGLMYPLERGFIFVHKPTVHIRFDEIASVNFARSGGSTRSFDVEVELKNGLVHTFSSIEKDEYGRLYDFVHSKHLRIKNSKGMSKSGTSAGGDADDMADSDKDDELDPYLQSVKAEGKERDEDDSDDESDDEDFNPDAVKGSGDSDVGEEYDTNHSSSSDDEDGSGGDGSDGEKKKKEKKKHKTKTIREPGTTSRKPKGEGATRRKKKKRDADMPKRPPTAYFIWLGENRENIKKDNPGISVTDILKKAGELWKNVDDKSRYEEEAAKLMVEYKKKMEEYKEKKKNEPASESEEEKSKPKKKKEGEEKKKKVSPSTAAKSKSSPVKAGDFKSKEYISSSSDSDSDSKAKKKGKKNESESEASAKASPKKSGSEKSADEEEILSTPESSSDASGSAMSE